MRTADTTRRRILERAYELFYRQGFGRAGVDAIAAQAGVTKRTLYAHFRSKDDLLAAVLEAQHELTLARVAAWTQKVQGDPAMMMDSLFAELAAWASRPRFAGTGFTRIVMELADLPGHPARKVARRHKAAIEAWFVNELKRRRVRDAALRAREIVLLIEGASALMLIHGDPKYAAAAAQAAKRLIAEA